MGRLLSFLCLARIFHENALASASPAVRLRRTGLASGFPVSWSQQVIDEISGLTIIAKNRTVNFAFRRLLIMVSFCVRIHSVCSRLVFSMGIRSVTVKGCGD
jgi:hypothetical protein